MKCKTTGRVAKVAGGWGHYFIYINGPCKTAVYRELLREIGDDHGENEDFLPPVLLEERESNWHPPGGRLSERDIALLRQGDPGARMMLCPRRAVLPPAQPPRRNIVMTLRSRSEVSEVPRRKWWRERKDRPVGQTAGEKGEGEGRRRRGADGEGKGPNP